MKINKGFTIIELLVVIAIISMIGSIIFIQLTSARARARDAKRESEIKSLQTALAIYNDTNRKFPFYTDEIINGSDQLTQDLHIAQALNGNIRDPLNVDNYRFIYNPTNGGAFTYDGSNYRIQYYLETNTIPNKSAGQQFTTP